MAKTYLTREEFSLYQQVRYLSGVISRHTRNEINCRYFICGGILCAIVAGATTLYSIIKGYTVPVVYFGATTTLATGKAILFALCPERKFSLATRKELNGIKETPEYASLVDKLMIIREQRRANA